MGLCLGAYVYPVASLRLVLQGGCCKCYQRSLLQLFSNQVIGFVLKAGCCNCSRRSLLQLFSKQVVAIVLKAGCCNRAQSRLLQLCSKPLVAIVLKGCCCNCFPSRLLGLALPLWGQNAWNRSQLYSRLLYGAVLKSSEYPLKR